MQAIKYSNNYSALMKDNGETQSLIFRDVKDVIALIEGYDGTAYQDTHLTIEEAQEALTPCQHLGKIALIVAFIDGTQNTVKNDNVFKAETFFTQRRG